MPCVMFLCLLAFASVTEAKRVVIFPMPFTSHIKYQINVARALTKLGHEAWLTLPDYVVAKNVLDTTNIPVLEYRALEYMEKRTNSAFREKFFKREADDWDLLISLLKDHCHSLLTNTSFFREIQKIQPDFAIIDNHPYLKMMVIVPYRLGIPFAFVGSVYDPISKRVPISPAVTPSPFFPFAHHMTLGQRLQNTLVYVVASLHDHFVYSDAVARYAPEVPYLPMDMLTARAELWLVEMDHILDYPRPSLPNVKFIGGTATGPAKPLPPPYKSFMDGATQGVVIVTFGSYVLDLPKVISDKIFKVLLDLPMKCVFRSNVTSPDPRKILTSTWIPQNDLLGHPNTKVFVSHSGKNGQYEAFYHAVPIVASPMFADQPYNALRMRSKGFGETVDIRTVSAEELKNTILKVATTKSYKEAISKASEMFRIEFGVPMERAAFWLDHVMKYGGDYMRSAGQEIPFYQFIGLDIFLCYFIAVFAVFSLIIGCVCKCFKLTISKRKRKAD